MEIILKFEKTSNPVFTEGKDLQGNMPTMPRTDSMFDKKPEKRPAETGDNGDMIHGQRHTGHQEKGKGVTAPGSSVYEGIPNLHIYFDHAGDYQPAGR